jgi:hypothetical protein
MDLKDMGFQDGRGLEVTQKVFSGGILYKHVNVRVLLSLS